MGNCSQVQGNMANSSNKFILENSPIQLNSNQWFVHHWWSFHPGHRMDPLGACLSGVYVIGKISIPYLQHLGEAWFVDPPQHHNVVMGRVIGKIHGAKRDACDGKIKTTCHDPTVHSRCVELHEFETPLVYACEFRHEPASPKSIARSEDSHTPSMVSYLE